MPAAFDVPADGEDVYRYFVIPSGFTEDKVVTALEFSPGAPKVVHHANYRPAQVSDAEIARLLERLPSLE